MLSLGIYPEMYSLGISNSMTTQVTLIKLRESENKINKHESEQEIFREEGS